MSVLTFSLVYAVVAFALICDGVVATKFKDAA
ncbi:hypothetical protein DFR37_105109 [Eoetvoesiella caeni]|uniref:Uncharacterized protein n=1 Tax=Eoetvoesiella caeni TaxID=645616 RepID=A0A366HC11_9BURK|nr:hypothetical protein DFR37_105109 [Eoetvoesiella caeni]